MQLILGLVRLLILRNYFEGKEYAGKNTPEREKAIAFGH
jgi:hypothetical protein